MIRSLRRSLNALLAALVMLALLGASPAFGNTITVTNTNDSGTGSLRAAIASALSGDTVNFSLAMYPATITLTSGELLISRDLTISGPGASNLAISANYNSRVFLISNGITVVISGLTIENGRSPAGAGIYNIGILALNSSTIAGNSAAIIGCAILNWATLTVTDSTISGNSEPSSEGCGIHNQGSLMVTNSTISGNTASRGGGIANFYGTVTLSNSTITGNSAVNEGGGIYNGQGTRMTLSNSTVSGNSASLNGGGILNEGPLMVKNSIVANSPSGGNCSQPYGGPLPTSLGHNLSDDSTCATFNQMGDHNSTPSGLDPGGLKDNGGPTQTIALVAASAAVDAVPVSSCTDVNGNPLAADQRGIARPQGPACDIGAFELIKNLQPVANAGPNQTVECAGRSGAVVTLNGSSSSDPDGDALTYLWKDEHGNTVGETAIVNNINVPLGVHLFTLTVADGHDNTATANVTITVRDTTPPTTIPTWSGPNANGWNNGSVTVALSATDSCTGVKEIDYSLTGAQSAGAVVAGGSASVAISAEGLTTLTYFARDNAGNQEDPRSLSVKIDETPPTLICSVSPSILWPPNHQMVAVTASITMKDLASGPAGFTLLSVTSSEPDSGLDNGDLPNDIQGFVIGTPDVSGFLRAERSGNGSGRVYRLAYRGIDVAGNSAQCAVTVSVPHNMPSQRLTRAPGSFQPQRTN